MFLQIRNYCKDIAARLYYKLRFVRKIFLKDFLDFKKARLFFQVLPYTMVSYEGIDNVYELAKTIEQNGIEGALVECGSWRGGVVGVMANVVHRAKSNRKIWLFDSFKGLPEPTTKDGEKAFIYSCGKKSGQLVSIQKCVASAEDVEKLLFSVLKLERDAIRIESGWFQDTLPLIKTKIGPIALLRIDADWYESVKCVLENLYDNVVSGGFIIIDDYGYWQGCKKAVDEFFKNRSINTEYRKVDESIVYFHK